MNNLESLKLSFPTGTTEGEMHLLSKAFVFDESFVRAVAPMQGSPRLIVGRKGAGKTALIEYLRLKLEADGVPVVLLRPDDFDVSALGTSADVANVKRVIFAFVTLAVANKLAVKGALATGHQATLDAAAKAYDNRNLDSVQALLPILLPVGKAVAGIDFAAMLPSNVPKPSETAAAIRKQLGSIDRVAYLIIDDTDLIGVPTEQSYLPRIWGLLLGLRRLATEAPNLKVVVTLRTEVWRRLRWDTRAQSDQVDHFLPLVVEWLPGDEHLRAIFRRRIGLAASEKPKRTADTGVRPDALLEFFEDRSVALPRSEEHRLWEDFLVKSARERPRDLIQLVGKLTDEALRVGAPRIGAGHLNAVIATYSTERLDYLHDEFMFDCDALRDVVRTLAELDNVVRSERLLDHLRGVPSAFRVAVRGKVLQPDSREDAFILWRLLHEAGVMNALVADSAASRGFRHVNFGDDPHLVTLARWNELQGMQWELHPAFRSALQQLRDDVVAKERLAGRSLLAARRPK